MAWTKEQLNNARIIESVGRQMGMSERDIQIALMTALTESRLVNVHYGDGSSLGLFQQIDSWGTAAQRENPQWAATAFYNALKGVTDRGTMTMGEAAQAVQRSAYPDRYATWQDEAAGLLGIKGQASGGSLPAGMGGFENVGTDIPAPAPTAPAGLTGLPNTTATKPNTAGLPGLAPAAPMTDALKTPGVAAYGAPTSSADYGAGSVTMPTIPGMGAPGAPVAGLGGSGSVAAGWRGQVVALARKFLGTPYKWGGSSPGGFDCSGLIQYIFKQAVGVNLPRISFQQANYGTRLSLNQLKPGDLVAWDNSSRNNGADHIAIYIGGGMIIEAPRPGMSVQISGLYDQGEAWGVGLNF